MDLSSQLFLRKHKRKCKSVLGHCYELFILCASGHETQNFKLCERNHGCIFVCVDDELLKKSRSAGLTSLEKELDIMAGVFQIMSGKRHGLISCSICDKLFKTVDEARTHHITDPGHRQKYARVVSIVSGKCLSTPKLTKVRPNSLALHTFIMRKISAGEI